MHCIRDTWDQVKDAVCKSALDRAEGNPAVKVMRIAKAIGCPPYLMVLRVCACDCRCRQVWAGQASGGATSMSAAKQWNRTS